MRRCVGLDFRLENISCFRDFDDSFLYLLFIEASEWRYVLPGDVCLVQHGHINFHSSNNTPFWYFLATKESEGFKLYVYAGSWPYVCYLVKATEVLSNSLTLKEINILSNQFFSHVYLQHTPTG